MQCMRYWHGTGCKASIYDILYPWTYIASFRPVAASEQDDNMCTGVKKNINSDANRNKSISSTVAERPRDWLSVVSFNSTILRPYQFVYNNRRLMWRFTDVLRFGVTVCRYKRSPTLGVIDIIDGQNLLTTLDTLPVIQLVVRRIISAEI